MKTKNKRKFPVSSFDICLSNRCNLMCKYCYFDSINKGESQFLKFEEIKKAIDTYVGFVSLSGIDKISIAGGEPFLDFDLLIRVIKYIRKRVGGRTDIEVFTNGTLASPAKVRELFSYNVKLVVSVDGLKESNDINRVFCSGEKSVFESVFKNMRALSKEEVLKISVGMTVTAKTAGNLVENIKFLREFGFGEVEINLNLMEMWSASSLRNLSRSIRRLKKYYISILSNEFKSYNNFRFGLEYVLLKWDEGLKESEVFKEISIAPDGHFYPCGLVSTYGCQKEKFRIGNLKEGLFPGRMKLLRNTAVREMRAGDSNCGLLEYIPNPMLLYFEALLKKTELKKVFENSKKIFKIFYDELSVFLRTERMLDVLSSDAKFGDFQHEPVLRTNKEISSLKFDLAKEKPEKEIKACACGKGWVSLKGLSEMREASDIMLYSRGENKSLFFNVSSVDLYFELIGSLMVYALLKAAYLRKNLSVFVIFPAQQIMPDNIEFLKSNRIFLMPIVKNIRDIKLLKNQNFRYSAPIAKLNEKNIHLMSKMCEDSAKTGFSEIRFEIAENFFTGLKREALLGKNIKKAMFFVASCLKEKKYFMIRDLSNVFDKNIFKSCPFYGSLRSNRKGGLYISDGGCLSDCSPSKIPVRKSKKELFVPYDKCAYSENSGVCLNCARVIREIFGNGRFVFEKNLKIEFLSVFSDSQKFELFKNAFRKNNLNERSKLFVDCDDEN